MKFWSVWLVIVLSSSFGCKQESTQPEPISGSQEAHNKGTAGKAHGTTSTTVDAPTPDTVCTHTIDIMLSEMSDERKALFADKRTEMQNSCVNEYNLKRTANGAKYAVVAKCMMQTTDRMGMEICRTVENED